MKLLRLTFGIILLVVALAIIASALLSMLFSIPLWSIIFGAALLF